MNETGSQLTYQPADRPPELRRPDYYPFPCCLGSGESWRAICCLGSSAYQDAHRSPGALIRRSLLRFRARRSRELPFRSMKHGPSAHGTAAERRSDCRAAATGSIILAEHGSLLGESWKIPEKEFPRRQCAWSDILRMCYGVCQALSQAALRCGEKELGRRRRPVFLYYSVF